MNKYAAKSNTSLRQAAMEQKQNLPVDSESTSNDKYDHKLIHVPKKIVRYTLSDEELHDNLRREARLFNLLRSDLSGVDNVRSIEVFKCEETRREYEATKEEFRLNRKVFQRPSIADEFMIVLLTCYSHTYTIPHTLTYLDHKKSRCGL